MQFKGEDGQASAFLTSFSVPLGLWCYITLELRGKMVSLCVEIVVNHRNRSIYSRIEKFDYLIS